MRTNVLLGGVERMRQQLLKICQRHDLVEMIYMRADGVVTKRRLQILSVGEDSFIAYCHLRRSKRTFKVDRVLSVRRVVIHESEAI